MRKLKKVIAITVLSMSITSSMGIVSWADTTNGIINQTDRWQGSGDSWKLLNESRNGYVTNSWFQDLDGSWYMLGADGTMFSGLVTDQSTGKSYLLNTNHDGTYGRMLHVNGTYTINGKSVYLEFNQQNDGTFGAITSGLGEARGSGVGEVSLPNIPTEDTKPDVPDTTTTTNTSNRGTSDGSLDWSKINPDDVVGSDTTIGGEWNTSNGDMGGLPDPSHYAGQDFGGYTGDMGTHWY